MKKEDEINEGRRNSETVSYHADTPLKQAPSSKSFMEYLYGENKIYSLLILFLVICQFVIFKMLYPFPDFFSDSYSYIFAAYAHLDVNIWPIGYSKFLSVFHSVTHSANALNFFQYIFLEGASLYFYHTIVYFYPTGKNTRTFLCLFLFFNPLFLYLSNYVSSDALFVGLSLIWLTQLIWIIHRPRLYQIFPQALLMFAAFTFRYNAMYYPIVAAIAFVLSKQNNWIKAAGILSGPLLILPFIFFCRQSSQTMTGTPQFPPILGGWQWANNALYMREHIDPDSTKFPSPETTELDRIARNFFRTVPPENRDLSDYVANFFIREPEAPLKQYMGRHYNPKSGYEDITAWGKVAPVFRQYGLYLINKYPLAFARYYMVLNTKNYFLPPLEKLEIYNLGLDEMWPIAGYWFGYRTLKVTSVSKTLQGTLLFFFTGLYLVLNLYLLAALYLFWRRGGLARAERRFSYTVFVIGSLLLFNFFFSVFANIIVIRYQVFPMIVFLCFTMLLTDWLEVAAWDRKRKLKEKTSNDPHYQPSQISQPENS